MDRKIEKKKWPPKRILSIAAISAFALIVLYYAIFGDYSSKLNVESERITISTVKYGAFQDFIPVSGTVQPIETFFLDVTEGGRVVEKFVEEGAYVDVGDPIIKLDNTDLTLRVMYNSSQLYLTTNNLRSTKLALQQNQLFLEGELMDLDYQIANQKRIYENQKQLYEKNLTSKIEFENEQEKYNYLLKRKELTLKNHKQDSLFRAQQVEQLEYSVKQMENNLTIIEQQLENLTVKAPIKGQLTSLNAEIGQSISRGQNLGQIDDIDAYKIRAAVDEHYIARVVKGQRGTFTFDNNSYILKIKTVYPEVSAGRFEVDLLFEGAVPTGIRRGQTVHIKLELSAPEEVLFVEMGGFYQTTGGQWIFVLENGENSAVRRNISLGRSNTQYVEILEGLTEGEKVITSSYDNYRDIDKLNIN